MDNDLTQTSTTTMDSSVESISVDSASTSGPLDQKENFYDNPDFSTWYGYYNDKDGTRGFPQLKKGIDAYATWVLGKGFTTNARTQAILDRISGKGEEDILAILWNLLVIAKVNGDSYAEVMRSDDGELLNLKPLSPEHVRVVSNKQGIIIRYEDKRTLQKFKPYKILHMSNERVADEQGGTSIMPAAKWVLDARQEGMEGYRRVLHRSTIRVMYVDIDDKTKHAQVKSDYADAIKNGELLILPVLPKDAKFEDLSVPPVQAFLDWIKYLENHIYVAIGIPKVIMGSVDSIPESGGKISYLTYEQIYSRETRQLEADLWNQLAIRIKFNPAASIAEGVADTANKSNAQTGFQPSDAQAGTL